jgi:3-oxoacyl-[acyl-carrier-protein] synthase II
MPREATEDIVITGLGITSPIGIDEKSFWESLTAGQSGAKQVAGFDTTDLPRSLACQVPDPVDVGMPVGRASRLAIAAARQAVASAALTPDELDASRLAITVGTTMGETEYIEDRLTAPEDNWLSSEHARQIARGKPGSIAGNVRTDLKIACPAMDLYGACAAGNLALCKARDDLLAGRCDVALAGGADGFSQLAFLGFMRLRIMSAGVCKPFDEQRDGLLVGEGSALFVLERESSARARGARIRARVAGCALTCEDYHPTRPEPHGDGLTRATIGALKDAGVSPSDIDYVCAHGTGTPQNDAIEVNVMHNCFPQGVAFNSIKALTGHTMGAAAALEAACCVLSLENGTLIPTWHLDKVLEPCEVDAIKDGPRSAKVRYAVNSSAGFGGYNSSVVLAVA